ncbi:MAG: TrkA family potassium uptake protein [Acidimicrobiales bacterium]
MPNARPRSIRAPRRGDDSVLVIGLGRFGGTLATTLVELGTTVLGVDASPSIVQAYAGRLTKVVEADATNPDVLEQLGATEFGEVVVAIGNLEASILTTTELVRVGCADVWAKALTDAHATILHRVGAHHVIRPEHDMGRRIAHMVNGRVLDYIPLDADFALVETLAPASLHGQALGAADVRQRFGVTVVCIKPEGEGFATATAESVIRPGDVLLVAGPTEQVEDFAFLA